MIDFSVSIELAFGEAGRSFPDRVRAAAAAGFKAVEIWDWRDKPLVELHFTKPVDHALLTRAARTVQPDVEVEAVDDKIARIAIPPASFVRMAGKRAFKTSIGDATALRTLFDQLVIPLHAENRIDRAELGGLVEKYAAA